MNKSTTNNDTELLEQLKKGDSEAFTTLYHSYSEPLYYRILSLVKDGNTAEELVQDIFTRIWNNRQHLDIRTSFAAWLYTVSRNRVYDFFRKMKADRQLYEHIKFIATQQYSHIEEALMAKENADLLQKAIESLPPQRRRAFELCKIEGHSYQQASEIMGVSLSTLKDHMAQARQSIRVFVNNNSELTIGIGWFLIWHALD